MHALDVLRRDGTDVLARLNEAVLDDLESDAPLASDLLPDLFQVPGATCGRAHPQQLV